MRRKEGAFLVAQALVVAGVLALLILPLNSPSVSASIRPQSPMRRKEGAFLVAQALVVAGVLALLILPLNSPSLSQTTSSTSSALSTSQSSSTSQPSSSTAADETIRDLGGSGEVVLTNSDLNLGLFLNSNVIGAGNGVSVQIDEKNPTDRGILVSTANDWAVPGLTLGQCGTLNDPFGVGIIAGYYTSENVSAASTLALYPPGTYSCPGILSGVTGYSFEGLSNLAGINEGQDSSPVLYQHMDVNVTASGSWTSTFHLFSPGYYTVVGGDEWGTLIIHHFLVVPALPPNQGFPLRFTLATNTTRPASGQAIEVGADIFNTLPQIVSINVTSNWAWPQLTGTCDFYADIVILRGYYTQSNMTTGATPLQWFPYGLGVLCPAAIGVGGHYLFEPMSDNATVYGNLVFPVRDVLIAYGYYAPGQTYNRNLPDGGEIVTPFEPGKYTVVAGDEWGQVAFDHFEVLSP
jgi:hypothetical protein